MTPRAGKLALVYYAAVGPLLIWSVYALARHRGLLPNAARFDDIVLAVALLSGACGSYRGLPGNRWVRSALAVVYLICMTWLVLYVGIMLECGFEACH
jgi:hypothetical protein